MTIDEDDQVASHQGRPASGRFRATHVLVRDGQRWRLAGVHLSPIGGPPLTRT